MRLKKWRQGRQAKQLLFQAVKLGTQGLEQEAEGVYQQLIETYPESIDGWMFYANFLASQNRIQAAIDLLREASDQFESNSKPLHSLGLLLRADNRSEDALEVFREAVKKDPDDISSWSAIVSISKELNIAPDVAYENLLRLRPTSYYQWIIYGEHLFNEGLFAESEHAFRQSLKYNRRCYFAWTTFGLALYSQDKFDQAIDAYEKSIEIEPLTEYAYKNLGTLLEAKGVIDSISRKDIDVVHPLARILIVSSISDEGDVNQIESDYRKSAQQNKRLEFNWRMLGLCLLSQSKYPEAEDSFRRLIEIKPKSFEGWSKLGISLIKQNQIQEGISAIKKAITLGQSSPQANSLRQLITNQSSPDTILRFHTSIFTER